MYCIKSAKHVSVYLNKLRECCVSDGELKLKGSAFCGISAFILRFIDLEVMTYETLKTKRKHVKWRIWTVWYEKGESLVIIIELVFWSMYWILFLDDYFNESSLIVCFNRFVGRNWHNYSTSILILVALLVVKHWLLSYS